MPNTLIGRALIALTFPAFFACAQPAENSARFAAADAHPSPAVTTPVFDSSFRPNGVYQLHNATLVDLIRTAWDLDTEFITGGPPWLDTDRFEINAKVPPKSSQADREAMLRTLLADRFRLSVHTGEKELEVYALTVGPRGANFQESGALGDRSCKGAFDAGPPPLLTQTCPSMTMADFAKHLHRMTLAGLHHPVADFTGLKAAYAITVKFGPNGAPKTNDAGQPVFTSIFDAVDKQLGLKLDLTRRAVPVLVVDRVERTPTPNDPEALKLIPTPETEFEAATIKVNKSGKDDRYYDAKPGGRFEAVNLPLKDLIETAWHYEFDDQIVGLPAWTEKERYDIVAKTALMPGDRPPPFEDVRLMLRALLIERFHMKVHEGEQSIKVWALTVSKRGSKLKDADPSGRSTCTRSPGQTGNGSAALPAMSYVCTNTTMAQFAAVLGTRIAGAYVDHPAVDLTGLKGSYDFTITWNSRDALSSGGGKPDQLDSAASDPSGGITFFDALEKQLGLHLEGGQKHRMPVLVIDRVEPLGPGQ